MRHRFGTYVNADAQMHVAGLLKQLGGCAVLTAADFDYPHKNVAVVERIQHHPAYRVRFSIVMHDGYKSLTGGDQGRHRPVWIVQSGMSTKRWPVPNTASGHVFGAEPEIDYRMTVAALVRRLGGRVDLREGDFPQDMGPGTTLFSTVWETAPFPLRSMKSGGASSRSRN